MTLSLLNAVSSFHAQETVRLPIGQSLLEAKLITRDQLQIALHEQKSSHELLGMTFVRLGFIKENKLAELLADRTGLKTIDFSEIILDRSLLEKLPRSVAKRCHAIPLNFKDNILEVAMSDPYDIVAQDEIRQHFPKNIHVIPYVASSTDISRAIEDYYGYASSLDGILSELENGAPSAHLSHPVVRLVETLLGDAVKHGASDLHLEPEGSLVRVRIRIDGILHSLRELHRTHWPALAQRIKLLAGLNIADPNSIQDGRFSFVHAGHEIDFRVAIMPTVNGENIVIRILDRQRALRPLSSLGFSSQCIDSLTSIIERPQGITLVTGPTGSGKTTTLYSILSRLNTPEVNIATLEEPVEYQMNLVRQTAIAENQGLSFAEGIRAVLRQDPDILFIGEIRDSDTAQMALRAAMTGHQVFATLHCQDVWGAIPRLIDLGLNPKLLIGHISGIIAQRLVRKLCPHCSIKTETSEEERRLLKLETTDHKHHSIPVGCNACNNTGRKGRMAIAEILPLNSEIEEQMLNNTSRALLKESARKEGFQSLQADGINRVLHHEVALSDLRRIVDLTREA